METTRTDEHADVTHLQKLVAEWRAIGRPLFIADEVRLPDSEHGDIIAFVFVQTDTRTACAFADEATSIRDRMRPPNGEALIKGADLYGSHQRRHHDEFRTYVEKAIAKCPAVVRVVTTSKTITRYTTIAPGGIRRVSIDPQEQLDPLSGRELVPFMNMLKIAAKLRGFGAEQIDVLVDRSAQLGVSASQLGIPDEGSVYLGPGTFNEQRDGFPPPVQSPCSFYLICPPKKSVFRDIALLADAVAYRMRPTLDRWSEPLRSRDFITDVIT